MRRLERHEWYLLVIGPPFVSPVTWASADWVHDTFGVSWLVVGARTASTKHLSLHES